MEHRYPAVLEEASGICLVLRPERRRKSEKTTLVDRFPRGDPLEAAAAGAGELGSICQLAARARAAAYVFDLVLELKKV